MKNILKIITLFLFLISSQINAQKIPITSVSKEAVKLYKKGWLLENKLEIAVAEEAYNGAIVLDSTFALAHLRLGMLRDNYDFRRAKLKEAMKSISQVSKGEQLWIKARNAFYGSGNTGDKEYNLFKELVELYPNDEKANYFFGFVNIHHGKHDNKTAIKFYKKAIALNPDYVIPYNELAYAYAGINDFENAKEFAQTSITSLPTSVNPLDTYAEILMRNGEYKKSIKAYNKVLKLMGSFLGQLWE